MNQRDTHVPVDVPVHPERARRQAGETGSSMIEAMLAATFLLPVLLGVVSLTGALGRTVDTNATATQAQGQLQRTLATISDFVLAAKMSTLRMTAVSADVDLALATTVGEWIDPTDLVWRPGVQFVAASGLLSMNAALDTSTRQVHFVLDPGEVPNGIDDDGDGLVDEGEVRLLHEGTQVAVIRGVESCLFQIDGRLLHMRLAVARRCGDGRIERAVLSRAVYLRNN